MVNTPSECVHWWQIEPPNGPTSTGRCKRCGAEKDFANSEEHSSWQQDGQARRQRAAAGYQAHEGGEQGGGGRRRVAR